MNILATFFLSIQLFFSGLFGTHTVPVPVEVPKTPEERILGTWKETYEKKADEVETPQGEDSSYVGFLKNGNTSYLRRYSGATDTVGSLYSISTWQLQKSTSTEALILKEFFYGSVSEDDSKDLWSVTFSSDNEMTLSSLYPDGSIPDVSYQREIHYKRVGDMLREKNKKLTHGEEEIKSFCDSLTNVGSAPPGTETFLLPVSCNITLGKDGEAILLISEDGIVTISQNQKVVIKLSSSEGDPNYAEVLSNYSSGPLFRHGTIEIKDITNDGYPDLKVLTNAGAYNYSYSYYIYDPKTHTFTTSPVLRDIVNPEEDIAAGTISYFNKGRGMADYYTSGTYTLKNGTYILTKEESQDFGPGCEISAQDCNYVHIVKKLINGKLVVTKKEIRTPEQVLGPVGPSE